jgi:Asp-tRNA(Asn)/Glu-tRNA(Gln) amidotransferase A subunit family amidase
MGSPEISWLTCMPLSFEARLVSIPAVTRRSFLQSSSAALAAFGLGRRPADAQGAPFEVAEKTVVELQEAMTSGRLTSAQLVGLYVARIDAYDRGGPRLNSIIAVNPNAAADARALDAERRRRGARGPLHGIPVLLKDNFDTQDMPTTGGSLALSGIVPATDAYQVRRLRQAGAVILGKVNLHELALGLTTISSLGGQTLNPYDLRRAPGGSSGGSGVAVAASFAAFAMGTDTSGSIRIPSAHNAVVGLRPTAGLSSRAGIIPFGYTQDTGGPIARTVADIAIALDATAGYDPGDVITSTSQGRIPATYTAALNAAALKGTRLGMLTEFFGTAAEDAEVAAVVRRALDDMRTAGATVVDVTIPNLAQQLTASNLLTQELEAYLGGYLRLSGSPVRSVDELLASGLHTFQLQGILEVANAQPDSYIGSDDHRRRLAARIALTGAVVTAMDALKLDAIVYPTVRRIAPELGGNQAGSNAGLSAQTGLPAIAVPGGWTPGGFPVGVELLGRPFAEPTLLGLAYAFEQATHHRRPPALGPALSPPLGGTLVARTAAEPGDAAAGGVTFTVRAAATTVRFTFDVPTRRLRYEIAMPNSRAAGGVYLHRRTTRSSGGVIHILAKSPAARLAGVVTLSEAESADLSAGKIYLSVTHAGRPGTAARADLVLRPQP